MFNNPYWVPQTTLVNPFPYVMPQPAQPIQPPQQIQPTPPQPTPPPTPPSPQTITPTNWNWKAVANYQSMLMESIPFDGAPVLFMVQNEPVFYVVRMEDGRKMINGFTFTPLDNPEEPTPAPVPETPEAQLENRLTGLENNMNSIMIQLQKLVEGNHHEPNNEHIETQSNQPITTKRKAVTNITQTD